LRIAAKEGVPLTAKAASRIFKQSRSNLRASLQVVDSMRARTAAAGVLHVPPMLHHPTVKPTEVSTVAIRRAACRFRLPLNPSGFPLIVGDGAHSRLTTNYQPQWRTETPGTIEIEKPLN
jgi:hypothetical protein